MRKLENELDLYIDASGPFQNRVDVDPDISSGFYWRRKTPRGFLNQFASRIVDYAPSTSNVERFHFKLSRTRTKQRNKLGYVRSQALAFLNCSLAQTDQQLTGDWKMMVEFVKDFSSTSDEDGIFLDELQSRIESVEAIDQEDNEEESNVSDSESSSDDKNSSSDEKVEEQVDNQNNTTALRSRSGRPFRPRIFKDFVFE
jgi:hypothetical protein